MVNFGKIIRAIFVLREEERRNICQPDLNIEIKLHGVILFNPLDGAGASQFLYILIYSINFSDFCKLILYYNNLSIVYMIHSYA